MVKLLAEPAPAKINLFLRVVGRRADGYHELDSVFVPVSLCDRVTVELRGAAERSIALRCDRGDIPADERNLAWRAADGFMREFGLGGAVIVGLHKEIPAGAGLGGGSSDAGAVLRMLAALGRTADASRLGRLALALGADVPFFLNPRPAHVTGVGERIAPLDRWTRLWMVIAAPPVEVSTAEVFGALKPAQWSGPAPAEYLYAAAAGEIIPAMLQNDLAVVAMERYPEIARLKSALEAAGATAAAMSGSGGAVFGLFAGPEEAARAASKARQAVPEGRFYVANSIG